jgi:hypothetical protein
MHSGTLSEGVQALLRDRVESFEAIEVLLLLRRCREQAWTPDAVARELSIEPAIAAEALDHLRRGNLLAARADGATMLFNYHPGDASLEAAVQGLARAYDENRLEVIKLMSANAIERVRTSAMKAFADAFLLGGTKDG